jgi:hypothetical protein
MKNKVVVPLFALLFAITLAGSGKVTSQENSQAITSGPEETTRLNGNEAFECYVNQLYNACQLNDADMDKEVFRKALVGYYNIKRRNYLQNSSILSVIDYSKASTEKRLWILDLEKKKLLVHSLVAHGRKSGENLATSFSNTVNSHMSSLGFYKTGKVYFGKHGKSLVLHGLDKHYNSNAEGRSVVIHAADYVCEDFIKANGRLGRSHGCPAVSAEESERIINLLEGGTCLFVYHPEFKAAHSEYLNEATAIESYSKRANML